MRNPDIAYTLVKTHNGLHKQALSAFNRFLRILDLKVERNARGEKQLVVSTEESIEMIRILLKRGAEPALQEEELGGSEDEKVDEGRQEERRGGRVAL